MDKFIQLSSLYISVLFSLSGASNITPQLYHTPGYQSPSETQSNRIVTIPGYDIDVNASVYYEEISDTDIIPSHPDFLPTDNTNKKEFVNIISNNDAPYSLSVKFPASATQEKIYALWVKNRQGDWSKRILLNDPRPQWIFPKRGYVTEGFSTFGRRYFIAGRNLKLAADQQLPITLTDNTTDTTYTVIPKIYKEKSAEYLLYFDLPSTMQEGNYTVTLFNRETQNQLTIRQDPLPKQRFDITDYGAMPNDDQDDTVAMRDAIAAAVANGGGEVYFPEGTWRLVKSDPANLYGGHHLPGHILKPHVDLTGAGRDKTVIKRIDADCNEAMFTLQGDNIVKGISFVDALSSEEYRTHSLALYMGKPPWWSHIPGPDIVKNVQIEACSFHEVGYAIGSRGLPVKELYVSDNIFHPYSEAIAIGGDPSLKSQYPKYKLFSNEEGVISNNIFYPGGAILYGDFNGETMPIQGPIPIGLSGTRRFAVVDNTLDGRIESDDFRGGIWWHTLDSSEYTLVANNKLHCTGDRGNWGEAIATDANYGSGAFAWSSEIIEADATTVTPAKPLDRNVTDYYQNYWMYIVDGIGMGQVRKVVSHSDQPNTPIEISPQWDVNPIAGKSKIIITTSYNWFYIVNNLIDQKDGCTKANPFNHAGVISIYATNADSVISYNRQIDADGISILSYNGTNGQMRSFNQLVKENFMQGTYGKKSENYGGGIGIGESMNKDGTQALHSFNVEIFKNVLEASDTKYGEKKLAIRYFRGHYIATYSKANKNLIISQNKISNVENGIGLMNYPDRYDYLFFNNIIYDNIFENVSGVTIEAFGTDTVVGNNEEK